MKLNSMSWLTILWNYAQTRCDLCLKHVCECLKSMPGSNKKLACINIKNMLNGLDSHQTAFVFSIIGTNNKRLWLERCSFTLQEIRWQ